MMDTRERNETMVELKQGAVMLPWGSRSGGERSDPERRDPAAPTAGALPLKDNERPDPEVPAKAWRRTFSAQYKKKILEEADACKDKPGGIGALLRREGLYSSHLTTWRKQRQKGELDALAPKKRGRKAKPINPLTRKVMELEAENRKLKKQLDKAETIISFQKKLSEILGISLDQKVSDETC